MTRRNIAAILAALAGAACGQWQRVGAPDRPQPSAVLPRLFDAGAAYRSMGFLVADAPLPFIAAVRHLAGPGDSALAVVSVSLANHALGFRRDGNEFVAEYHVDVAFRGDSGAAAKQVGRDESVRVRSFQETLRSDESVIFQQYATLKPGIYVVTVMVRDRNGPGYGRAERVDTVPALRNGLSSPIPYYEGAGRDSLGALPHLLLNPRATLPYGTDTLRFYVEAYGAAPAARVAARAEDRDGLVFWNDTVPLTAARGFASAVVSVPPDKLPIGEARLVLQRVDGSGEARAPFLVSFSNQWVITNFDEMISLLRYFDDQAFVSKLRDAPPDQRLAVWREFWKSTDPVPMTPENEALDAYFQRLQIANQRFSDEGDPGWLTDRGEVFITLGDPDEVEDLSSELGRAGQHVLRWTYTDLRTTLYFQDDGGFGRFRLTPQSRADYQSALMRKRRSQ